MISKNQTLTSDDGVTKTYEEWARHYSVSVETLRIRVKNKWPISEVLSTRKGRGGKKLGFTMKDEPVAPTFDFNQRHAKWRVEDE